MKLSVFYEHIVEAAMQEQCTIDEIAMQIKACKISAVEIEDKRLYSDEDNILMFLKRFDLSISCIYGFFDFAHQDSLEDGRKMIRLAQRTGAKHIMLIPGFLSEEEFEEPVYGHKVEQMIVTLDKLSKEAKEYGITTVLEDFDGADAPFATAKQLSRFIKEISNLYCTFDTGNFLFSEEEALDVLPMFLDKIVHVHCKDRTFVPKEKEIPKETIAGRKMYSAAVGSGCIKMKEILDCIEKTGYNDFLAIEHFGSLCQLKDMKQSAEWLNNNYRIED